MLLNDTGLGEGCVVVASRTFVAHAFYGRDGAFAQGVLIASNNLAMVASKIIIPWLVEESNKNIVMAASESSTSHNNDNDISSGIAACCVAMLISLGAGILYALWFGVPPHEMVQREHYYSEPQHAGEPSGETSERKKVKDQVISKSIVTSMTAYCQKLPQTFWLVAVARAIFVVTFKVFSHNSNSILMVSIDIYYQHLCEESLTVYIYINMLIFICMFVCVFLTKTPSKMLTTKNTGKIRSRCRFSRQKVQPA